jgi:hypothetical protein
MQNYFSPVHLYQSAADHNILSVHRVQKIGCSCFQQLQLKTVSFGQCGQRKHIVPHYIGEGNMPCGGQQVGHVHNGFIAIPNLGSIIELVCPLTNLNEIFL